MENKDQILADFQVCSGIYDVGEAFTHLEANNWNLIAAVNSVLPPEVNAASLNYEFQQPRTGSAATPEELVVPPLPGPTPVSDAGPSAAEGDGGGGGGGGGGATAASGSGDKNNEETIIINVKVLIGGLVGDANFPLERPLTTKVGELKTTLYQLLGIMPCKQVLKGLVDGVTDTTSLSPSIFINGTTLEVDTNDGTPSPAIVPYKNAEVESEPEVMEIDDNGDFKPVISKGLANKITSNYLTSLPSSSSSIESSILNSLSAPSTSRANNVNSYNSVRKNKTKLTSDVESCDIDESEDEVKLNIKDLISSQTYTLPFRKSRRIGEIKQDVHAITTIPVHRQIWTGWPAFVKDYMTLSEGHVTNNTNLTVASSPSPLLPKPSSTADAGSKNSSSKSTNKKASVLYTVDDDSSQDEFEDAAELNNDDDDDFMELLDGSVADSKPTPLLPESIGTPEQDCVDHFVREFTKRYGTAIPFFFQGPLREAIDQSLNLPAAQRRILAVYIHHDGSVLANVFCSQVLCQALTITVLADHYVLWGWDITTTGHRESLVSMIDQLLGAGAGISLRGFAVEQMPALMLFTKNRSTCEVLSIIYATSTLDEVVTSLMEAAEVFEGTRSTEVAEDRERQSRQAIMDDQDAAYQESLRADKAKAERRKQQEEEEQRELQLKESLRLHELEVTEKLRQSLQSELPEEPSNTDGNDVTVMRFRQPGKDPFTRAFYLINTLQDVLNYLHVMNFPADQYKFIQSWPRRDLSSLNVSMTLKELGISKQETVTIEER